MFYLNNIFHFFFLPTLPSIPLPIHSSLLCLHKERYTPPMGLNKHGTSNWYHLNLKSWVSKDIRITATYASQRHPLALCDYWWMFSCLFTLAYLLAFSIIPSCSFLVYSSISGTPSSAVPKSTVSSLVNEKHGPESDAEIRPSVCVNSTFPQCCSCTSQSRHEERSNLKLGTVSIMAHCEDVHVALF